jgi:hypothetical protein
MASRLSSSRLCIANAVLTVPWGVSGLAVPAPAFRVFGLKDLEDTTIPVIRAYGATALAYGIAMLLLRDKAKEDKEVEKPLLISSSAFNCAQMGLQLHAVLNVAGFNNVVWVPVVAHGILALWSVKNLISGFFKRSKANTD